MKNSGSTGRLLPPRRRYSAYALAARHRAGRGISRSCSSDRPATSIACALSRRSTGAWSFSPRSSASASPVLARRLHARSRRLRCRVAVSSARSPAADPSAVRDPWTWRVGSDRAGRGARRGGTGAHGGRRGAVLSPHQAGDGLTWQLGPSALITARHRSQPNWGRGAKRRLLSRLESNVRSARNTLSAQPIPIQHTIWQAGQPTPLKWRHTVERLKAASPNGAG